MRLLATPKVLKDLAARTPYLRELIYSAWAGDGPSSFVVREPIPPVDVTAPMDGDLAVGNLVVRTVTVQIHIARDLGRPVGVTLRCANAKDLKRLEKWAKAE